MRDFFAQFRQLRMIYLTHPLSSDIPSWNGSSAFRLSDEDQISILTSGGTLLLREVEKRTHILERLGNCFIDHRNPKFIEHTVDALIKQRVLGIAMGYEEE